MWQEIIILHTVYIMLLSPEELKQQTRDLWKNCFHENDDFLDIYFEDKYRPGRNITARPYGDVVAAAQLLPYRMTFYGNVLYTGYVSGLCVHPDFRRRGLSSQILYQAHRDLYRQGGTLSFLIPGSEDLRRFYEDKDHGAYWTSTYRMEVSFTAGDDLDDSVTVERPEEWGEDLYVYFRRNTGYDFMFHPSHDDFFAALSVCDLEDGYVLVARRRQHIAGICLAVREADGRIFFRSQLVADEKVRHSFVSYLCAQTGADKVYARVPVPGSTKQAVPYAMARVINVEKFLRSVLRAYPGFQIHIGVDGDMHIPENNGYYIIEDGKLRITDRQPDTVVTPGGLAALFLSAQPTYVEMMLDE